MQGERHKNNDILFHFRKDGLPMTKLSQLMRAAGYTDVERGERDSTEEHLTVTQFKVQREQERLGSLSAKIDQKEQHLTRPVKPFQKRRKSLPSFRRKLLL